MKRNPRTLLWIGLVLLGIGLFLNYGPGSGPAAASAEAEQACRAEMDKRGPEGRQMADQCTEENFATLITATDASTASAAIAANNRLEVGGGALGQFLIGMGLVLTSAGLILPLIRKKEE